MTNEELLSVAEIVERLVTRLHKQAADHEAKMVEHRAAFGARTVADAKIIAGLRQEVQALREALAKEQELHAKTALRMATDAAKLAERKHPVKVGEYVKRLTGFNTTLAGEIGKVTRVDDDAAEIEYEVKRPNGETGVWCAKNCEPCDPPTEATHDTPEGKASAESVVRDDRNTEPKPGDTVRLVRIPSRADVSPEIQTALEWPWLERWGTLNQTALVVEPAYQLAGAVPVFLSTNVHARWPICCIEVVRTEPDEIKVGDLVEVVSNRGSNTWFADVGSFGTVTSVEEINDSILVNLDNVPGKKNALVGCVSFCDVRKVTT